ncbi:hypothetical protein BLNAU_16648 [Blattamonas nauphoetae]|uniref:HECT domain-containing protein n=1 Tax=Blattamonas nauphoetae TaxID=2049346 RepID=A0ABQ9XAV3_9EUKA|nr:hypothetical protein BLNAU_16648 [Blattamonas nauphoetae]
MFATSENPSSKIQEVTLPTSTEKSSTPNVWLEKVESLKTESDENKVRISRELVDACLDDSEHSKGTLLQLMDARILPILAIELRRVLPQKLRVGFQVLFDTVLTVLTEQGGLSLSKHFPSILALSQSSTSRISEPVIETIGLLAHTLSSRTDVDEFLRSGILESLVLSLRTHPDGQVRQTIVVALGEIGIGLKMAVIREKRGGDGWKRQEKEGEGKKGEKEGDTEEVSLSGAKGRGRGERQAGRWLLGGNVSHADLLSLASESWIGVDSDGMNLETRCRRGVRMAGQALLGVLKGWGKEEGGAKPKTGDKGQKEKKDETDSDDGTEEKERVWENDVGVLEAAGSVCGLVFSEVFTERNNDTVYRIAVREEDIEEMKTVEENKTKIEQQLQYEREQAKKEKEEMEKLIAELRQNQRPPLAVISEINCIFTNTSEWIRKGNHFAKSSGVTSTVIIDHVLTSGIWQLTLRIVQCSSSDFFGVGFIESTKTPFPDVQSIGFTNTSLSFCTGNQCLVKCHKGQSYTTHGSNVVSFTTGDEVVLEVDMVEHTCHLFVNSLQSKEFVQTKVFARGISASVKLAISTACQTHSFKVQSLKEVEKSSAVTLPDAVMDDLRKSQRDLSDTAFSISCIESTVEQIIQSTPNDLTLAGNVTKPRLPNKLKKSGPSTPSKPGSAKKKKGTPKTQSKSGASTPATKVEENEDQEAVDLADDGVVEKRPYAADLIILITDFPSDLPLLLSLERKLNEHHEQIGSIISIRSVPLINQDYLTQLSYGYSPSLFPPSIFIDPSNNGEKKEKRKTPSDQKPSEKQTKTKKGESAPQVEYFLTEDGNNVLNTNFDDHQDIGKELLETMASTEQGESELTLCNLVTILKSLSDNLSTPLFTLSFLARVQSQEILSGIPIQAAELKTPQFPQLNESIAEDSDTDSVHTIQSSAKNKAKASQPAPKAKRASKLSKSIDMTEEDAEESRVDGFMLLSQMLPSHPTLPEPSNGSQFFAGPSSVLYRRKDDAQILAEIEDIVEEGREKTFSQIQLTTGIQTEIETFDQIEKRHINARKARIMTTLASEHDDRPTLMSDSILTTDTSQTNDHPAIHHPLLDLAPLPLELYIHSNTAKPVLGGTDVKQLPPAIPEDEDIPEHMSEEKNKKVKGKKKKEELKLRPPSNEKKSRKGKITQQTDKSAVTDVPLDNTTKRNPVTSSELLGQTLTLAQPAQSMETLLPSDICLDLRGYRKTMREEGRKVGNALNNSQQSYGQGEDGWKLDASGGRMWVKHRKDEEKGERKGVSEEYRTANLGEFQSIEREETVLWSVLQSVEELATKLSHYGTHNSPDNNFEKRQKADRLRSTTASSLSRLLQGSNRRGALKQAASTPPESPPPHATVLPNTTSSPFKSAMVAASGMNWSRQNSQKRLGRREKDGQKAKHGHSYSMSLSQVAKWDETFFEQEKMNLAQKHFNDNLPRVYQTNKTLFLTHFSQSVRIPPLLFAFLSTNSHTNTPSSLKSILPLTKSMIDSRFSSTIPFQPLAIEAASFSTAFNNPNLSPTLISAGNWTQKTETGVIPSASSLVLSSRQKYYTTTSEKPVFIRKKKGERQFVPFSTLHTLPSNRDNQAVQTTATISSTSLFPSIFHITRSMDYSFTSFQSSFHSAKFKKEEDVRKKPDQIIAALLSLPSLAPFLVATRKNSVVGRSNSIHSKKKKSNTDKSNIKHVQFQAVLTNEALITHGPGLIYSNLVDVLAPLIAPFTFHSHNAAFQKKLKAQTINKAKERIAIQSISGPSQLNSVILQNGVTLPIISPTNPREVGQNSSLFILQLPPFMQSASSFTSHFTPSLLPLFISQHFSLRSFKSFVLNCAESIRLASKDSIFIDTALHTLFPASSLPPDTLTLSDTTGDFAEVRDFFNTISELDMRNVIRDWDLSHDPDNPFEVSSMLYAPTSPGNASPSSSVVYKGEDETEEKHVGMEMLDDALFRVLLCATFSDMLNNKADPRFHSSVVSSQSVTSGGCFVAPQLFSTFFPTSSLDPNVQLACFVPMTPFTSSSGPVEQLPSTGTAVPSQFSFTNPHVKFTLPSLIEQHNRSTLGSFLFVSEKDDATDDSSDASTTDLRRVSVAHVSPNTPSNLRQFGRQTVTGSNPYSSLTLLSPASTPPPSPAVVSPHQSSIGPSTNVNFSFVPFGNGEKWNGKPNTETLFDQVHSNEPKSKSKALRSRAALHDSKKPGDPLSSTVTTDKNTVNSKPQRVFKNLRAIYAPPIVDSSDFAVVEEHTSDSLALSVSQLILHDFPVRTRYLSVEDCLLMAVGCVGEREGQNGIDRTYWVKRASPNAGEIGVRMREQFVDFATKATTNPSSIDQLVISAKLFEQSTPLNEQFCTFAAPREKIMVKHTLERTGSSLETSVAAFHKRGHVFRMTRPAKLKIGVDAPTDVELSKETLSMYMNDGQTEEDGERGMAEQQRSPSSRLSPSLLAFTLSLRELLETVPLSSVNDSYHIILNELRKAEAERVEEKEDKIEAVEQTKEKTKEKKKKGGSGDVSVTQSVDLTPPKSHPSFLPALLRAPLSEKLKNAIISVSPASLLRPSPLNNHAPLSIVLSPLLSTIFNFFDTESPSASLVPALSSHIHSLLFQQSVGNRTSPLDVEAALEQVRDAFNTQLAPVAGEDIIKNHFASSQLSLSHLAKFVLTNDVVQQFKRIVRNPLRSLFAAVFKTALLPHIHQTSQKLLANRGAMNAQKDKTRSDSVTVVPAELPTSQTPIALSFSKLASFTTTFNDKATLSVKLDEEKSNSPQFPYTLSYSTMDGQIVSIQSEDGSVTIRQCPQPGERLMETVLSNEGGNLLMPDDSIIPTPHLLAHRQKEAERFVRAARLLAIEQAKEGLERYKKGEMVCGMQQLAEKEELDLQPIPSPKKGKKIEKSPISNKPGSPKVPKRGKKEDTAAETDQITLCNLDETEKELFRRVFTSALSNIFNRADPSFPAAQLPIYQTSETEQINQTRNITTANTLHRSTLDTIQSTLRSPFITQTQSPIGHSSVQNGLTRGLNWSLSPQLQKTLPISAQFSPSPLFISQPLYECERVVRGMGTSIVRMNSGEVAVLLGNGDVSVCDGNEWSSVNEMGQRSSRPFFSLPIIPLAAENPDLLNEEEAKEEADLSLLRSCFEGIELPTLIQMSEPSNDSTIPLSLTNLDGLTITLPDSTPLQPSRLAHNEVALSPTSEQPSTFATPRNEQYDADLTQTVNASLIFPSHFPLPASTSQTLCTLHPIQSVRAINSVVTASVRTRADKVTIVQHNTGERLVHHADGTRIFHSFSFADDTEQRERYEKETESQVPVRAVLCVEHRNSPRVLIYLVQKNIGNLFHPVQGRPSLSPSELSIHSFGNEAFWERERVVVCLSDGTSIEWSANEHKTVLSKTDNTHVHVSNNSSVSVFCENPTRKPPVKFGPSNRLPLLHISLSDGSMTVRPSKKSIPLSTSATGQSSSALLRGPPTSVGAPRITFPAKADQENGGNQTSIESVTQKKIPTARRVLFVGLEGTVQWVVARTMKTAVPPRRLSSAFSPTLFDQVGMSPDLNQSSSINNDTDGFVSSLLSFDGADDVDSVENMEKKVKEMRQVKEQIEEQRQDEIRKQKRKAAQQAKMLSRQSPASTPTSGDPSVTPANSETHSKHSPSPFEDGGIEIEQKEKEETNELATRFPNKLKLSTKRWAARLAALHAHQLQLSQDLLVQTSRPGHSVSASSLHATPAVLPRLFVVRHDGSGFELLRRKAVSKLYPKAKDQRFSQSPLITSSTNLLTPTVTVKAKRPKQEMRTSPSYTRIPIIRSPSPVALSPQSNLQPPLPSVHSHSQSSLHSDASQSNPIEKILTKHPLFAYYSPYATVTSVFYDVLASSTVQSRLVDIRSDPSTPSEPFSPLSIGNSDPPLGSESVPGLTPVDQGLLRASYKTPSQSIPTNLSVPSVQEDPFMPSPSQPEQVSLDTFTMVEIGQLVKKTQEPLPALFGHGEAGLQLSLQQFSSSIPTAIPQAVAGQTLVVAQDDTTEKDVSDNSSTHATPPSRLNPRSVSQSPAPISTLKNKQAVMSDFSKRVSFFHPTSNFPPGTLISPAPISSMHLKTPNPHRLPFTHHLESSSQRKKVGLTSVTEETVPPQPRTPKTISPALLSSPLVQGMRRKTPVPNASFRRARKAGEQARTLPVVGSGDEKQDPSADNLDGSKAQTFTIDSFTFEDRPSIEQGITICVPVVKMDETTAAEKRATVLAVLNSDSPSPVSPTTTAPNTAFLSPTSSVLHTCYQPCTNQTKLDPCDCQFSRNNKQDGLSALPSANLYSVNADPNPVWCPYLPELLRFEPLSIREHYLPEHVQSLNLPPSEVQRILNGEQKIPLPTNNSSAGKDTAGTVFYTKLVEHPPPPPLLILILYELITVSSYLLHVRSGKAFNRLNAAVAAWMDKSWSSFADSVKWIGESVLTIRSHQVLRLQMQRLLGLLTGMPTAHKEPEKDDKSDKPDKSPAGKKGKGKKTTEVAAEPEEEAPQQPLHTSTTTAALRRNASKKEAASSLAALCHQTLPSLAATNLKRDELYPIAVAVLFDKHPNLRAIMNGAVAEERIVSELLSSGWRRNGGLDAFQVPFISLKSNKNLPLSSVFSFGGFREAHRLLDSFFPTTPPTIIHKTNLPHLCSSLAQPPVKRSSASPTKQLMSPRAGSSASAQKSKILADKLFLRNIIISRHERSKVKAELEELYSGYQSFAPAPLKSTTLPIPTSPFTDFSAHLLNAALLEKALSLAAVAGGTNMDQYGSFSALIKPDLDKIKGKLPPPPPAESVTRQNVVPKRPGHMFDAMKLGAIRQKSFVMGSAQSWKGRMSVKSMPGTNFGPSALGQSKLNDKEHSSVLGDDDSPVPESEPYSGMSSPINLSRTNSSSYLPQMMQRPQAGRVLSYFDSLEGQSWQRSTTSSVRPSSSPTISTTTSSYTPVSASVVTRTKMEAGAAGAFPPPDIARQLVLQQKDARRKGLQYQKASENKDGNGEQHKHRPRPTSTLRPFSPPPDSALSAERRTTSSGNLWKRAPISNDAANRPVRSFTSIGRSRAGKY